MSGKHLILDIDETLLCYSFPRPYLKEFMYFVFKNFTSVSLWTAATSNWLEYCHKNILLPHMPPNSEFKFMWHRKKCDAKLFNNITKTPINANSTFDKIASGNFIYYKSLQKVFSEFEELNEKNTIIIDDNILTCLENKHNSIHIKEFDDPIDIELLKIIVFIRTYLLHVDDVRLVNKLNWEEKYQ